MGSTGAYEYSNLSSRQCWWQNSKTRSNMCIRSNIEIHFWRLVIAAPETVAKTSLKCWAFSNVNPHMCIQEAKMRRNLYLYRSFYESRHPIGLCHPTQVGGHRKYSVVKVRFTTDRWWRRKECVIFMVYFLHMSPIINGSLWKVTYESRQSTIWVFRDPWGAVPLDCMLDGFWMGFGMWLLGHFSQMSHELYGSFAESNP